MTRDEIRGLIGGYATGSLSEAERKLLFEAALDDQELFDELAREQALKELLEAPGVKPRLIGALAPQLQKAWWAKAWIWAATGAFAVAVIAGFVLFQKPREVQIAQVTAPAPVPEPPAPPPILSPPSAPAPVIPKQAVPIAPAPVSKKTPPPQRDIEALAAVPAPARPLAPQPAPAVGTGAIPAGDSGAGAGGGGGGGRGGRAAGFGGVVGGANRAAGQSFAALAARPSSFSFNYSVTPDGLLRITPEAPGFLTLGVNNTVAATVLFSGRPVQAGSAIDVMLPADSTSATIILEASPPTAQAKETDISDAVANGATDPPSGTKSDPNPSPTSRLIAVIRVNPQR